MDDTTYKIEFSHSDWVELLRYLQGIMYPSGTSDPMFTPSVAVIKSANYARNALELLNGVAPAALVCDIEYALSNSIKRAHDECAKPPQKEPKRISYP